MGASVTSDRATHDQDDDGICRQLPAADIENQDQSPEKVSVEVFLPTAFVRHVRNVIGRRGIALDDLIFELLSRYVPDVVIAQADHPKNAALQGNSTGRETMT